jgi:hypothetical protein
VSNKYKIVIHHTISIKHRIWATFNINKKKSILTAFKKKIYGGHADDKKNNPSTRIRMSVGGIAINTPNYKSAAFPRFAEH